MKRISETCIWCGELGYVVKVRPTMIVSADGDRYCRSCGAHWSPPTPRWVGGCFLAALVPATFVMAGGTLSYLLQPAGVQPGQIVIGIVVLGICAAAIYPSFRIARGDFRSATVRRQGFMPLPVDVRDGGNTADEDVAEEEECEDSE